MLSPRAFKKHAQANHDTFSFLYSPTSNIHILMPNNPAQNSPPAMYPVPILHENISTPAYEESYITQPDRAKKPPLMRKNGSFECLSKFNPNVDREKQAMP